MNYMKDSLLNKQKKIEIYSTAKNIPNSWTLSKKVFTIIYLFIYYYHYFLKM